jgi:glycosyltransferase involved in cell wall biosynthesis
LSACEASVLIATRDRAGSLERTLACLARQEAVDFPWELIVVDNGSRDDTKQVLDRHATDLPLVVLTEPQAGKNRALNHALEVARGSLLVFTDDDITMGPGWLAALVRASRRFRDASVFGGPIVPVFPPDAPDWLRSPDFVLASEAFGWRPAAAEGPGEAAPFGANLALRARLFESLRFDERLGPAGSRYAQGGEWELLMRLRRAGEVFVHVPDAPVEHTILPHQIERTWLLERAHRIGRGSARIKGRRVPCGAVGWLRLHLHLGAARARALLARRLADPERFAVEHRVDYWRGYIDESRRIRAERVAAARGVPPAEHAGRVGID